MKVLLFLLPFICLARAEEPETEDGLGHYKRLELSEGFRRYETGCSQEVNTCLKEMHVSVHRCVAQWKRQAGPRYDECIRNDPVVANASRDWQMPSFKWHKAMDKCLRGEDAPTVETLQSWAIEYAAMAYYSRKKRDTPTADDVAACWRAARQKSDQCKEKASQCTRFAHCYGEGAEPSNESAKRWFNHIKTLRTETKNKSKIHVMHMGHCLRNEPHTSGDHGGHHGMHH